MENKYKLGSLFDGSGGFPLAGSLCGIEPVWAAEVEPYPIAVTRSRFPSMKHLGDISKVNGAEIKPVDIITFGSPCQDLSVAGKRAGLKHEANGDEETTRSGLFMEAVRIIKEMRSATDGEYPAFALWENVPGAFSSNKGEDFRIVCEELIKIVEPSASMPEVPKNGWPYADSYRGDGWSLAYRVFDAQYWGVPQRRRRIHLVLDLRGERAREVLFEREGVRGYFTQGRTPWQTTAGDAQDRTGADDRAGVVPGVAYSFDSLASNSMKSSNPHSGCRQVEVAKCLDTTDPNPSKNQGGIAVVEKVFAVDQGGGKSGANVHNNLSPTLCTTHGGEPAVAYTLKIRSGCDGGGKGALVQEDKSATLATNNDQYLFQPVSIENHPADSRVDIDNSGKVQTLTSRMGTGGGNVPMVMEPKPVICLQGNGIDRADTAGCNGKGWKEDICYTLNTIDRPGVAYSINHQGGNVEQVIEEMTGTLTAAMNTSGNNKLSVAYAMQGFGDYKDCGVASGLKARDYKDATDLAVEAYGVDCRNATEYPELNGTIQAKANGGFSANCNQIVRVRYIVRRLTPTERARLQGFADRWGGIDEKDSFSPEEYAFWQEVRNTHAAINGKKVQEYTEQQMLTWYNKLHTDSAEYKMWGNGIALPPALYCLQGIANALENAYAE